MADSPSTDNYTLGKGIVYFNRLVSGVYSGERDLGNAPAFTFNIALEKLDHYSSRGGLKAKDKEIISQITPGCAFTLDEINTENFALLTLGDLVEISQVAGHVADEDVVAHLGKRSTLSKRNLEYLELPYDTGTVLFTVGETITGAGGAAGIVTAVVGDATSGTLAVIKTNTTAFVDSEVLTGGTAGSAAVNSATGGTKGVSASILVQDATKTTTYVAGVDYEVNTALKDGAIGRIHFLEGGSIAEGDAVKVTFGYGASTYTEIRAFNQTQVEGFLRFVSDNPAGTQQELQIWRCSLTPSGDTAMIGDDWSTLAFAGEILKDEVGHPDSPYMNIIMD